MDCLGILESGNYAYKVCSILERKGYVFEVVSIPCQISKSGCGHCLKFPEEYTDVVVREAALNRTPIMEIYVIKPGYNKNKYIKKEF
ncbi:MAG TPA: putative Se/S carrier-like protein [Pseudobacteroides sp.]|uniref:putative Se/S carrier-like protein n=1 Tax=Pseudobacteroides sp. TaxID=1968840 RepID=UPI002F927B91